VQWGAPPGPQQPRRDTAGPSSTALHRPRPGARGAGDGGAERGLGAGVHGEDGASRCGRGNPCTPRTRAGSSGSCAFRVLGVRGLAPCRSGGPALLAGSRWEKHFQAAFKQPGLFFAPLHPPDSPGRGESHRSIPDALQPARCGRPGSWGMRWEGGVQAGAVPGFPEGAENVPNPQNHPPCTLAARTGHWSRGGGSTTPGLADAGASGRILAPSWLRRGQK